MVLLLYIHKHSARLILSQGCDLIEDLITMLKLSEYSEALSKLEKERYKQKLVEINCNVDPYIDDSYDCGSVPVVRYTNIYDLLICSSNDPSCDGKPV